MDLQQEQQRQVDTRPDGSEAVQLEKSSPPELRSWLSLEVVGEIVLLAVVGAFLGYFLVKSSPWLIGSSTWPSGSSTLPRVAVLIGIPFWLFRVWSVVRRSNRTSGTIMDLGFTIGREPKAELLRFVRIMSAIFGLFLSIWLVGFHLALPLWVMGYLIIYGKAPWWGAVLAGAGFEAFLWGVFDYVLLTEWPLPKIFSWVGADYFFTY